jgi:pimeloyl-ACP methyl ester carboxylesterase
MLFPVTVPRQVFINSSASIPPPSAKAFDEKFGGFLPKRHTLTTPVGQTTYYLYSSKSSPSLSSDTSSGIHPRRVVLLHGVSTPCINYVPLVNHLLEGEFSSKGPTEILIYDLWGHGLSSTPLLPHTPSLFTLQLLHIMSHLSWPQAHIVGYSGSGAIAISFAAYHPEAVSSVTLVAPTGLFHSSQVSYWDRAVQSGGPFGLWEHVALQNALNIVDGGEPPFVSPEIAEKMKRGEKVYDMDAVQVWQRKNHPGNIATIRSMNREGCLYDKHMEWKMVADMGLPAMVVLGETDSTFSEEVVTRECKKLGWKGDIHVVKGVGHLVPRFKPKETAELLDGFWRTVEGKSN